MVHNGGHTRLRRRKLNKTDHVKINQRAYILTEFYFVIKILYVRKVQRRLHHNNMVHISINVRNPATDERMLAYSFGKASTMNEFVSVEKMLTKIRKIYT